MNMQPNRLRGSELPFSAPTTGTFDQTDSVVQPPQNGASAPQQSDDASNAQQNQQSANSDEQGVGTPTRPGRGDGSATSDNSSASGSGGTDTGGAGGSGSGDTAGDAGGAGGESAGLLRTGDVGSIPDGSGAQLADTSNMLGDGNILGSVNPANIGNVIDGVLHTADSGVIGPVVGALDGLLVGDVANSTLGGGGLLAGTPLAGDGGFANVNLMRADDSSSADLAQVGVGSDLTQSLVSGSAGGGGLLAGTPLQSDGTAISANVLSEGNSSSSDLAQAGVGTDLSQSLIDVDAASDRGTSESNQIIGTDIGPQSGDSGIVADAMSDRGSSGSLIDADAGQHQGPSLIDANVATAADQFQFPGLDGVGIDSLAGEVGQTVGSIDDGALDVLPVSAGVDGSVLLQVDATGQVDSGATGADDGLHLMANTPLHGSLLGA
jgi:hypothetical protein